jgi:hypothetical protein
MPDRAPIDELDAVRRFQADPPPPRDAAVARAESLLRAEIAGRRPRRRRRRIALGLVPVALVAAGAGYALHEPARVDAGIACGSEAKGSPDITIVLPPDAGDPVAACAALWRKADLGAMPGRTAPELTACVAPTGAVYVLPGGGTGFCERAGAADVPPDYRERRERFAELFTTLQRQFSKGDGQGINPDFVCIADYATAVDAVRRTLDAHGFGDWRVETSDQRFGPDRRCATLAYDERRRTVTVIPV